MMTWERLDRRLKWFSWGFLAALSFYGVVFVMATLEGAEAWQVAAILMLGFLTMIGALTNLSLAQAWVDERRNQGDR
jgi:hypothetical protein